MATEEPLEIRLNGRSLVVTMRTPGEDEDLARGFLVCEGILRPDAAVRFATIVNPLDASRGNIVNVSAEPAAVLRNPAQRGFHASSACGVCGQASLEDMARRFPVVESNLTLSAAVLSRLPAAMREAQRVFAQTGGLHAAALFDASGALLCLREDIGRHNALDKVVGWAAREGRLPLAGSVLVVSGRAGYEIVQKAVAAGIPFVASVGAPSSLAAHQAEAGGVTLVGFLNAEAFNVYTHPGRLAA